MFTIMFIIMFIIMFTSMFIIRFTIMVTIGFTITFSDNFTLSRLCDLRRIVTWRCWCTALGCGLGDWCRRDWCLAAAGAIGWAGLLLGIVALRWLGSLASLFRRFRLKKLAPGLLELVLEPCLAVQELKPCFYCTYVISFCTSIITYVIFCTSISKPFGKGIVFHPVAAQLDACRADVEGCLKSRSRNASPRLLAADNLERFIRAPFQFRLFLPLLIY